MEIFQKAKTVRLRSHHDKYLLADEDEETVYQDRNGCYKNAKWAVEIVENANFIRLKSCYGKYLTASNMPFLFGARGKKVLQTIPRRLDSSLEWEPLREGVQVRLKTRYGQFLRANGRLPPWRNSITHDIPHRTSTQDWILWDVDIVEIRPKQNDDDRDRGRDHHEQQQQQQRQQQQQQPPPQKQRTRPTPIAMPARSAPPSQSSSASDGSEFDYFSKIELRSPKPNEAKEDFSCDVLSPKKEGRTIFYDVGDEKGNVDPNDEKFFTFKGSSVNELNEKLKEEIGRDDILVCCRNPLNGNLYPLRLQLPPNNTDMHVIVVPSSFKRLGIRNRMGEKMKEIDQREEKEKEGG
ncbi:Actin cross-linking [Senna tora]|uniref:Actin cross-linking n=1 Tax=Senna tora TaxID=362788 RepID=A0A834W204_9FABA|nr:Actin cross-linking [Senna tora]